MQRRSTARNAPRKKYTVDAFEGIPELADVAEDETIPGPGADSSDSEVEADGLEHESEDDDVLPLDDQEGGGSADESGEDLAYGPIDDPTVDSVRVGRRLAQKRRAETIIELKEIPGIIEAQRRWAKDRTLPTRKEGSMRLTVKHHAFDQTVGGYHRSFSQTDEAREEQARTGWIWYLDHGGKDCFRARQTLETSNAEDAEQYMGSSEPRNFVMGPQADQKLFSLRAGQSVALTEAWPTHATQTQAPPRYKAGFILNLGARTRGLNWVPGQSDNMQYLTTWPAPDTESTTGTGAMKGAICIWRFYSDTRGYISVGVKPSLKLVICTMWGPIRAAEWCPIPLREADHLGLLALVTDDGTLRVLDVPAPSEDDASVRLLVKEPASRFKPTDNACTCAAWLSPTRIAVGCIDGTAHILDLSESVAAETSTGSSRLVRMSNTYIQSISSCAPAHPAHLLTSSADGTLTVVDLDEDEADQRPATVNANKPHNTITQPLLLWHDYSQRSLASDDNCEVLLRPLRIRKRLQQPPVARARSAITAMAGSVCHPCILMGTAGGEVFATNPVLKIPTDQKSGWRQQTWFAHEWRRPTAAEDAAQEGAMVVDDKDDAGPSAIGKHGLSRFLDDFKAEHVLPDTKGKAPAAAARGTYIIYEEKTAITALAWNPNLNYGGWAAAAMADGLVRVEDTAV